MQGLLAYLTGFIVTCTLIYLLSPLARRIGLADSPGGHKRHRGDIPLVGGIAMFCGFMFAALTLQEGLAPYRPLFASAALLVIVGVLDDFRELRPNARFLAQIGAGLLMTLWGGQVILDLGPLVGAAATGLGPWAIPFTVFSVVGVINAVNMLDGIDGLAGGLTGLVFLLLGGAALRAGMTGHAMLLFTLAAVALAFLCFNLQLPGRRRALVFMGDAGSMFLGFALAWFLVALSQDPARPIAPVTALWLLALPLMDTVYIMLRRILGGHSPFCADRGHLHHALQALGLNALQTLWAVLGLSLLLASTGIVAQSQGVPERYMFSAFLALFALYCWVMSRTWRRLADSASAPC